MGTTQLILIPDHAGRSNRRFLHSWRERPRIKALLASMALAVQLEEDLQFSAVAGTTLDAASGQSLDWWGELVGQDRQTLGDQAYRRMIKARALANVCRGDADSLLGVWQAATAPIRMRLWEFQPATIVLVAIRDTAMSDAEARVTRSILRAAKPAGVTMDLIEALISPFGYDGGDGVAGYDVGPFARLLL